MTVRYSRNLAPQILARAVETCRTDGVETRGRVGFVRLVGRRQAFEIASRSGRRDSAALRLAARPTNDCVPVAGVRCDLTR